MKNDCDSPTSHPEGKSWIYYNLEKLKSQNNLTRFIDIGCGMGEYSIFFRTLFPNTHWTAVEIWNPYVEKYNLTELYDELIISDACIVDYENLLPFDVAFVGDVLEHMEKDKAVNLVQKLLNRCQYIIVSIPIIYYPINNFIENPYSVHVKPDWSDKEFKEEFANYIIDEYVGEILGTYILRKNTGL